MSRSDRPQSDQIVMQRVEVVSFAGHRSPCLVGRVASRSKCVYHRYIWGCRCSRVSIWLLSEYGKEVVDFAGKDQSSVESTIFSVQIREEGGR